ncbi:uncharacterized protein VTP21DRAFT_4273 [Calcarisporiella thermophila]|uniref:uncharacterized protein n=1 Tax=Calcarisporiella thermophila TaxID=911321 RepID=UPI0037420CBA
MKYFFYFVALLFYIVSAPGVAHRDKNKDRCKDIDIEIFSKPNFKDTVYANGQLQSGECYSLKVEHRVRSFKIPRAARIQFFCKRRCVDSDIFSGKGSDNDVDFKARSFKIFCKKDY